MRSTNTRAAGLLILILGVWGGLVPFVAPYFHFAMGPDKSWTWTSGRLWLDVLPGIVAVIGGLLLLGAGSRPSGKLGALMALASGIWFAIGPNVSLLWNANGAEGTAHGSTGIRTLEMLTYHTLLGVVMAALAGYALPGLVTRRAAAEAAEEDAVAPAAVAGAGAGVDPATSRVHRPVRTDERRPVHSDEPVRLGSDTTREPVASAVGRGDGDTHQTAVLDRPTSSELPARDDAGAPPADTEPADVDAPAPTQPAAASTQPAPAASQPAPAATQPAPATTSNGSPEPTTVRRRHGGLLTRLRR